MCGDIRRLLERVHLTSASNFVFAHHDGWKCRLDVWETLKKAQKLAGITGRLRVHDLRHTCAVRLRENGVPLETIMGILRHADIEETLIYAPYQRDEGAKAIRWLDTSEPRPEAGRERVGNIHCMGRAEIQTTGL
jgi:site-specific recombinase XerD